MTVNFFKLEDTFFICYTLCIIDKGDGNMPKKKTFEEFEKDVKNKYGNEYTIYPPYINSKTNIKVTHNICGRTFEIRPNNLLTGQGCAICNREKGNSKRRKTTSQFIKEVNKYYGEGHYKVLGEYKTANTPIKIKHLDCGNTYKARPADLIRGHGCQKCAYRVRAKKIGDAHRYDLKQAKEQLNKYLGNDYQLMLNKEEDYKGNRQHIPVKHLVCGNIYYPRMSDIQSGTSSCSYCKGSAPEKIINQILMNDYHLKLNEDYYYGYVIPENKLHLDFYFPKINMAIEYDGEQHYSQVKHWANIEYVRTQDTKKNIYCAKSNILLIRIPYVLKSYKNLSKFIKNISSLLCGTK